MEQRDSKILRIILFEGLANFTVLIIKLLVGVSTGSLAVLGVGGVCTIQRVRSRYNYKSDAQYLKTKNFIFPTRELQAPAYQALS